MALFSKITSVLKRGLTRTRDAITSGFDFLRGRALDEALIEEVRRKLIQADVGLKTTTRLIEGIRADFKEGKLKRGEDVLEYLKRELSAMWPAQDRTLHLAP